MAEVYVGNLDPNITTLDIQDELQHYGEIRKIKVPRTFKARGYAFVEFENHRDAIFAIQSWNRKFGWRVELPRNYAMLLRDRGVGRSSSFRRSFGTNNCYRCGNYGHIARNCTFGYQKDMKNKGVKQSRRGRMKKNQIVTLIWKPIPPPPPWLELPEGITMTILHKLGPIEIMVTAQKVCTAWRKICKDPSMWRVIDMWKFRPVDEIVDPYYNVRNEFCRLAVDLSQGQATEINIEINNVNYGEDVLLGYIAERNLRYLGIAFLASARYHDRFIASLKMAVMKFPLLEELQLHLICQPVWEHDIEAIGQSCPMLKKFALNANVRIYVGIYDKIRGGNEEAFGVATSMPELRHLELIKSRMTNEGLEAILNGCPKLESLDLRECLHLHLEAGLEKRCARQIKLLRLPHDSIDDYAWVVDNSNVGYDSWVDDWSDDLSDNYDGQDWSEDYDGHDWSDDYDGHDWSDDYDGHD